MASSTALLVLGLLALANSAPWHSDMPKCAHECPIAGSPKLAYAPEKTYSYSYSGQSEIHMKDVQGGVSQLEWSSQVDLTWLSPCDMAISFKNPSFGGASGIPEASFLTRYPLVVAMTDGRVQHVCSHPEDDTWSINLKKGVASAFQNSLPSNSSVNSGLNFTETDVAGNCPTMYEVKNQGETVIVEKIKNHRFCQERFPNQAETPMSWIKAPLPIQESWSKCKQEITKGIYTSINCEDMNVIKPMIGSYKYVEAKQVSKLQYQSESSSAPSAISNLRGQLQHRSLRFDHETLKKDPKMTAQLEQVLKQVCEKTKQGIHKETASLVDKAIHLMRRIPEESLEQMLQKVKSGEICTEKQKMESLFLDAIAFVQEASAVKFMVREILSGQTSGGRAALYTAALYFTPRPSLQAVEALKPLFEQSQRFPMVSLAAASMVNTYCRHNPRCHEEAPVRQCADVLSHNIQQHCTSSAAEETQKACLASIKALGNMGVMTSEVARTIISCMEKEEMENHIRVAASQTFRNAKCNLESTRKLIAIAVDPMKTTEIRIASYLASVKCIQVDDLKEITNKISKEENTQVRGFILSHLMNLQRSSDPHKESIRYMLSSISVPTNFSADIRKYSQNIDLSYYVPSLGIGAGLESNILYAPRSFCPRSVNLNLTSVLGATPVNLGEFGVRVEGLQPMLEEVFGPEGYFQRSSMNQIFRDISEFARREGTDIVEHLKNSIRERRAINMSAISHFFSRMYGEQKNKDPRADLFARFNGQEVAYASLTKRFMENVNINTLMDTFLDLVEESLGKMKNMNVDTARTLQIDFDYLIPTIQGMPLKMELNGTAVVGLKVESRLNGLESSSPNMLKIIPGISTEIMGFIGYKTVLASCGVRTQNLIASNEGVSVNIKGGKMFEIELDLPEKMEIVDIKSETYLMKSVRGQPETKIQPQGVRQSPVQQQNCFNSLEQNIGLKVCYDLTLPNIFKSEGLPLGPGLMAKLTIEKSEPSMKGYVMRGHLVNSQSMKEVKMQVETVGSSTPRKGEAHFLYSMEEESGKILATVSSQSSGGMKMEVKTKYGESEKEFEMIGYSSRSQQFSAESQVVEAKVSSKYNGQETQVQILTQTKNALKPYIDHYFEVRGDLEYDSMMEVSYPRRLEVFDLQTIVRDFKVIASVQKKSDAEFISVIRVGSKSEDKLAVKAEHNIEGSWDQGFTIKTAAAGEIGEAKYKVALDLYNTQEKKGTFLEVLRPQESSKVVHLEAHVAKSRQSHQAIFQLDIPQYMQAIKLDSHVEERGSHSYYLQVALKHGSKVILNADGPVTAMFTYTMKQFQADVRVEVLSMEPHRISSVLIWARNKQVLSFELKDQRDPIVALEWNVLSETEEQTKASFKLLIPSIIHNKIDALVNRRQIHMTLNTIVSPKSSSAYRVKGFTDVDFEAKKVKTEVSWNADKDPSKKFSAECTILGSSSSTRQTVAQGTWTYIGSTYRYKADIGQSDSEAWLLGTKDIKFELSTPSQKTYIIETKTDIEENSSECKVNAEMKYKDPENREYKVSSLMSLKGHSWPRDFECNLRSDWVFPGGKQSWVNLQAKHHLTESQRMIEAEMKIKTASSSRPLETSFTLAHQPGSYQAKWMDNVESSAEVAQYELKLSQQSGIESVKIGFNVKEIQKVLDAAQKLVGMESVRRGVREESSYLFEYKNHPQSTHTTVLKTPSRTMEGEIQYSPSQYSIRLYTNKHRNNAKYEISLTHEKTSTPWEKQTRIGGNLDHPSLERERKFEILYTTNEEKTQGTVSLDIFPRPEDKITGTLESIKIAKHSLKLEAKLSGKVLTVNPKLIVTASYAPHTVGFDVVFEKNPSARPSVIISGKYDRRSGRNAAIAFTVKTEETPVVDISASVKAEEESVCNGVKVSAVAHSSVIGTYDIVSKLCKPGFMKTELKKHGSNMVYIVRGGLLATENIELSVSEKNEELQEQKHMAMIRVKLVSPTVVNAEMKYESEKVSSLWDTLSDKCSRITSSAAEWMDTMYQEIVKQSGSSTPSVEIARLWEEAKDEGKRIYNDLVEDNVIPSSETLQRWVEKQPTKSIISVYKKLWSNVNEIRRTLNTSIPSSIRSLKNQFGAITDISETAVVGIARWIQTGEMPADMKQLLEKMQQSSLWVDIKRFLYHLESMLFEERDAIVEIFRKYRETLIKDLNKIREDILNHREVREIIDWVIHHMRFDQMVTKQVEHVLDKFVQASLLSSVQMRNSHVEVQIPLRRPVNSLTEALKHISANPIPVPENMLRMYEAMTLRSTDYLVWSYYTLWPQHTFRELVPPYNSTAMVIDGSEILTFDGTVLRAPHSHCKVLLAAFRSHSLVMEHPQPAPASPQVTLKTTGVTVVVKPDHKVTVNGKEVTGQHTTEGKVQIWMNQDEIKVMSPFMILRVFPRNKVVSLEVSGWTFGHVAGLFGTYDGEKANDWATLQGSQASSMQELVKSWQEDQQCLTPSISVMSANQVPPMRYLQCQALLGVRSRCNPVVRPVPFIQMCYSSRNACDVAKAYQSICSSKGVKHIFPLAC